MDSKLRILAERLERIFPHLKLYYEGEYFTDEQRQKSGKRSEMEKLKIECDFAPPMEYNWYDIIKILKENGLEIKNSKE